MATQTEFDLTVTPLDCACVIHGDTYDWVYVERLYAMLTRNISRPIKFHVYTESTRSVPDHMIKHELIDWGFGGPKKGWWYKMQLFNTAFHAGHLLYFDLDVVIVNNIDWIWNLSPRYFWAVRDFKYLWRPANQGLNSSIMKWDTRQYDHVWQSLSKTDIHALVKKYPGDQDCLNAILDPRFIRFFDTNHVKSWRWQCKDGGYDFKKRMFLNPNTGTQIDPATSVLIFHGAPKPKDIQDQLIDRHWR